MTDFETAFADELAEVPEEHFDHGRFVPAAGSLDADAVLVGEAPGATEVEQGVPFVGQAGTQLDRALEQAGVDRADLYVTNLVKVRPPGNRTPHSDEIEAWRPLLDAEIERVDPDVVVPMGTTATRELLDTEEGITDLHGRRFERDGRTVVPTYHPAAVLYDRSKLSALEDDIVVALADDAGAS